MEKVKERLFYIDNLRLLMIVFVVMHHLAVTYSGFGSWYYYESSHLGILSTVWFAFYLAFQQAYFMGLLFMIAGYFAEGSYDRKGFGHFVGDRLKRLGIPSLIYMVVITPFINIVEIGHKGKVSISDFLSGTGVMWFAVALFFFSLIYSVVRLIARKPIHVDRQPLKPSFVNAVILILIISVCAFLIRLVQPVGTNILNMQIGYFASYIILFIVGILAYRNNLLAQISYKAGKRWLISSIVLGFPVCLVIVGTADMSGNIVALNGGLNLFSAAYSVWESFTAVAVSIGLIAVLREKFNRQNRLVKTLSDNAFAVYMFHPPILVAIALLLRPVSLLPIAKWLLLCIICVPLCFATAHFVIRRIPLLKNIL